jgi:hypothetical protein
MGVEHRWNERQTTDCSVLINARPHGLRQARIRDVSTSGLFVELPSSASLANNAHVELIFTPSANDMSQILWVPALVARTTQSGAGLMFLDPSRMAFRTLLAQLLAEKKQAAPPSRAMLEQAHLDALQYIANAMAQSTHSADAGISELLPDRLAPNPRLPGSWPV